MMDKRFIAKRIEAEAGQYNETTTSNDSPPHGVHSYMSYVLVHSLLLNSDEAVVGPSE